MVVHYTSLLHPLLTFLPVVYVPTTTSNTSSCPVEYAAVPSSRCSSMDFSCLKSEATPRSDHAGIGTESEDADTATEVSFPVSNAAALSLSGRRRRGGGRDGEIDRNDSGIAEGGDVAGNGEGSRTGPVLEGVAFPAAVPPDNTASVRSALDRPAGESTSRRRLGILCDEMSQEAFSCAVSAEHDAVPSPVTSRRNSSTGHNSQPPPVSLSAVTCMALGGLNEWLVMNMRSQGVPYGTPRERGAGAEQHGESPSQASIAFNKIADRFLEELAGATALQRDIEEYLTLQKVLCLQQEGRLPSMGGDSKEGVECRSVAVCVASDILHKGYMSHVNRQRQAVVRPTQTDTSEDYRADAKAEACHGHRTRRVQDKLSIVSQSVQLCDRGSCKGSFSKHTDQKSDVRQSWSGRVPSADDKDGSSNISDAKRERRLEKQAMTDGYQCKHEVNRGLPGDILEKGSQTQDKSKIAGEAILRKAIRDSNIATIRTAMTLGRIAGQIVVESI